MLEDSYELIDSAKDMLEYDEEIREELFSDDPMSVGVQLKVKVMESDEILQAGLMYIIQDQLWGKQVDMYGAKLPSYAPNTIRQKAKLGHPMDKLSNYTYYWSGAFYNEGVYIYVDAASDYWQFENTMARDYFEYVDEDVFGLTNDNFSMLMNDVEEILEDERYEYYKEKMMERGYDFLF